MTEPVRELRQQIFAKPWPLDDEILSASAGVTTHAFLANPSGHIAYVYLTQFVKATCEMKWGTPFANLRILDWGCGKGHVSKLMRDLGPGELDSCDLLAGDDDSTFGQATPIITRFGIEVKPLEHEVVLPYEDATFDAVLSFGVLEHVTNDRGSLAEIDRVLKPGGLFFCFFLPTQRSWTQKLAHLRGNDYHDRLYSAATVRTMLAERRFVLLDLWYRQLFPKNTVRYARWRSMERVDQALTESTPLGVFATNIEFVCQKPAPGTTRM